MMAELKSKAVRTVFNRKVVRLKIDIPYCRFKDTRIDEKDALEFLYQRVGASIGIQISALDAEVQKDLDPAAAQPIDVSSGDRA